MFGAGPWHGIEPLASFEETHAWLEALKREIDNLDCELIYGRYGDKVELRAKVAEHTFAEDLLRMKNYDAYATERGFPQASVRDEPLAEEPSEKYAGERCYKALQKILLQRRESTGSSLAELAADFGMSANRVSIIIKSMWRAKEPFSAIETGAASIYQEQEAKPSGTRQTRGGFTFEELAVLYAARFERSLFREPRDIQLDDDTEWIVNYDPEAARFIRDHFVSIDWVARHGKRVEEYREIYLSAFEFGFEHGWLGFMLKEAKQAGPLQIREWALDYKIAIPDSGPIPEQTRREILDAYRTDCEARDASNRKNFDVVRAVLGLGGLPEGYRSDEFHFGVKTKGRAADTGESNSEDSASFDEEDLHAIARERALIMSLETFGLSEKQIAEAVTSYRPKAPIKPLARQLGITPAQVVTLLKQRSPVRVIREKPDAEDLAQMRRRYEIDGEGLQKISRALGYSTFAIREHLFEQGVAIRARPGREKSRATHPTRA